MITWQPIGPGTWTPNKETTLEDIIAEQRADAACALAPAAVHTGTDPDQNQDDKALAGITFQKCGGGRRVIRKKIGGA